MGLFSNIMSKIFGSPAGASSAPSPTSSPTTTPGQTQAQTPAPGAPAPAAAPTVDVTAILDGMAAKNSEKLDWRHSIVDLMKLIGVDSSLSARKELAKELNYSGDTSDSASMNIWLHKEVIKKLAANGGKVPAELLD